jgi:hypothetical protein
MSETNTVSDAYTTGVTDATATLSALQKDEADVSGVTLAGLTARVSALETQIAGAASGNVGDIASLASTAAADAAEAKSIASDAQASVAAVKTDVSDVQGLLAELEPAFARLKSFFSHIF